MKAVAIFSFEGNPALSQLFFPVGAEIRAKSASNKNGWMFGSYGGQHGWFPVSYVELQTPLVMSGRQQERQQRRSLKSSYQRPLQDAAASDANDIPPVTSISFESTKSVPSITPSNGQNQKDDAFPLMGGVPGSLFGFPTHHMHTIEEEEEKNAFQQLANRPSDEPVDIYRHAPASKKGYNSKSEYSPEITVQVTAKPRSFSSSPPTIGSRAKVAPQATPSPEDFWKAHPGRAPGPTSADQAFELERAFEGIREEDKIEIIVEKKTKFGGISKKLKKIAQKTIDGIKLQQ